MSQVTAESHAATPTADFSFREQETFGHPRGLFVLVGTEFWDRVSFHGMQALLVLYMVEQLLLPGHVENVVGVILSCARLLRRELGTVGRH